MANGFDEQKEFAEWFNACYKVAVWFEGGKLCIPQKSGKSVPVIAHTAWAAWNERAQHSNSKIKM